ncbi:MAG: glycosyltransferase family 2 protein [Pseudomonadota bacterium]|nr:glycosyltransferase family 2 protein [Pseudomonadota bacterium]
MATAPHILVIIVTWNKKQYILNLLASLTQLAYPQDALDIVVVDNASEDDTVAAITQAYPQVRLLQNTENLGGTGGFNTGLSWAFQQNDYQYLWLLDNDVLVHQQALATLVHLLESQPEVAVAGSTMLQLDYPWRVNEMGAFVNRGLGTLVLNRHLEEIPALQGHSLATLQSLPIDLTQLLLHCQPSMDVDYVAAASLLVRAEVARQAGLWRNYFIHFDDVEWCLRIKRHLGQRVVVSAQSLIWHLSAAAKVPTWVLYYDNRNMLDLLKTHDVAPQELQRVMRRVLLKALYYQIIAKPDLAHLHHRALADFQAGRNGHQDIQLEVDYQPLAAVLPILLAPTINRILIAWTLNLQAMELQEPLIQAQLKRPELVIDFLTLPGGEARFQMPWSRFIFMPKRLTRWLTYWQLRGQYDLVIQSDYQPSLGLAWLNAEQLFVNDEGFCQRSKPKFKAVVDAGWQFLRSFFWRKDNFLQPAKPIEPWVKKTYKSDDSTC